MIEKILVAIDLSSMSDRVFEEALSLAKAMQASMMLLHAITAEESASPKVVPPGSMVSGYYQISSVSFENFRTEWEAYVNRGADKLKHYAERSQAQGVSVDYTQISGSPGSSICSFAKTWEADAIVIGRRGYSGMAEFFMGSVSNYVFHHSPCSVLIINAKQS
jgi:nucleotide-binding universal stress UspA family protein